jgi:hypothetical protein
VNASDIHIPAGPNQGVRLARAGPQWVAWALRQEWPLEFRFALEEYARERFPDVYLRFALEEIAR